MRPTPAMAVLFSLLLLPAVSLSAQDDRRVIKIGSVSGDALGPGEAAALRGLVSSYAVERGGFRIIDERGLGIAPEEVPGAVGAAPLAADYLLGADASRIGGRIALSLEITKLSTGERKTVGETFADVNDLVLSSRRMTATLFDRAFGASASGTAGNPAAAAGGEAASEAAAAGGPFARAPRLSAIAGTWNGDKGIDSVSFRPDGRGFALLDSGARMMLRAAVSGSFVIVTQDQPNSPDFYRPDLDLKSARIVSAAARRWKWIFSLAADGGTLKGFKESVFVKVDERGAVSVDNDYSREALWTRRSR